MSKWKMLPVVLAAAISVPVVAQSANNNDQKIQQDIQKQLSKDKYKNVNAQM